ncbi:undecaprenyl-diphosphate phosphatase [uncultured Algimonas sp.]|uniref:undecaprenyl-diphosphate phosphatase n=1 Tax=uncultured Algimonas sp. TaxID=1547920 RepID=UPI0026253361|nr:undecaprenyl-diphosphate phosphatase [uncultured Algimonas sp.]
MTWWQALLLALIQGLTEFLPVSSSAHLILPQAVFGWTEQGVLIDVMAHFGTLFSVLLYFRRDVAEMLAGLGDLLARRLTRGAVLALNLIVATPPALLIGVLLASGGWDEALRSPWIIAVATILFGVVLWLSDVMARQDRDMDTLSWRGAFIMGAAQVLAFIPGTSRSGITMTAGRAIGLSRDAAARFSMLMSLPVIGAGGAYALVKLATGEETGGATLGQGLLVAALSFIVAYAAIALFLRFVTRIGFLPFMIYRVLLGVALIVWLVI